MQERNIIGGTTAAAISPFVAFFQALWPFLLLAIILIIADTRFSGTRSNPDLKGGLFDITTENLTPGDVKCAFLNGIIKELYDMYVSMNVSRSSLIGSGNGIRKNKALRQTCENMFGAKMKTPLHLEEAAFGAALFAMTAIGKFDNVKQIIRYEQ